MPIARVDDVDLYYELNGTGESLVLIPGLGGDVESLERLVAELGATFRVLAFDPRGAGRSDKPDRPYAMETMAADTERLMQAVGFDAAHVFGYSMGGRIALALALSQPERVNSLILAGSSARTVESPRQRMRRLVRTGRDARRAPGYARQQTAWRESNCSDRLGQVHAPTLIVHSRDDRVVPYRLAEELRLGIAGAELVPLSGDHVRVLTDDAPRVAELVRDFVAGR